MIRVETVTLPAFLASALVNGDTSGLHPGNGDPEPGCSASPDFRWLDLALAFVEPGRVVSCEDDTFFGTIAIAGHRFTGDLLRYVVHYDGED